MLPVGTVPAELATELGCKTGDLKTMATEACSTASRAVAAQVWTSPDDEALLPDLLRLAAENRRLRDTAVRERLEQDVDDLHRTVEKQRAGEAERLKVQKLNALAEFAAGAGHEINNPLAVISGQAQYLLNRESEPAHQRVLEKIVAQSERIHQILRELRQFARPPQPRKQVIDILSLIREVAVSLNELAIERRVRLLCPDLEHGVSLYADPDQVRTALKCLVRNAVEAARVDGWASVRLEMPEPDQVDVVIEDSGPGPDPAQREHMFDPFYSGRAAGRGRGLGLPTAWRLAREHGGDVRFVPVEGGPTRFVLSLPTDSGKGLQEDLTHDDNSITNEVRTCP